LEKKFTAEKNLNFFAQIAICLSIGLHKEEVAGAAFSPQKKTSSTFKHEISYLFPIFLGHFCPPGSGSGPTYLIESGSNSDTKTVL
jgi:hypothetical protein